MPRTTSNATYRRKRGKPIPADLRPVLIERIAELRSQGLYDAEIGAQLGYSKDTIRVLRNEGGIPSIERKKGDRKRNDDPAKDLKPCPACQLSVVVRGDRIEQHKGLLGPRTPGARSRLPVPCPASGCRYGPLARALTLRADGLAMAA